MEKATFSYSLEVGKLLFLKVIFFVFGTTLISAQTNFETEVETTEGYMIGILNPKNHLATDEAITVDDMPAPNAAMQFIWLPMYLTDTDSEQPPPFYNLPEEKVIYADFYLLPGVVSSFSELPEISGYPIAAMTGLVGVEDVLGEFVCVYGDGAGSGIWQSTGYYIELKDGLVPEQLWYVYKLDYANNHYDFFVDGIPIAEKVPFVDSGVTQLDQIEIETNGAEAAYFDRLTVSRDRPAGLDHSSLAMSLNETKTAAQSAIKGGVHGLVQETSSATVSVDINLYVDCAIGNDSYNGLSAGPVEPEPGYGPKASIAAAFAAADDLDSILLQSCNYDESILDLKGKTLTLYLNGPVTID